MSTSPLSVVMLGATGAVGSQTVRTLVALPRMERVTLLGRRPLSGVTEPFVHQRIVHQHIVHQHSIDIFDPTSYQELLSGHRTAICTLGVGQPSKISKDEFVKIDKLAVLDFASACKKAGASHFELLASVGVDAKSSSFYLRTKGELVNELKALDFERLSIFQPSMILTPTNRYGFAQGMTLRLWPLLKPVLQGSLRKYRGIPVELLGQAIAVNILSNKAGVEALQWDDFVALAHTASPT